MGDLRIADQMNSPVDFPGLPRYLGDRALEPTLLVRDTHHSRLPFLVVGKRVFTHAPLLIPSSNRLCQGHFIPTLHLIDAFAQTYLTLLVLRCQQRNPPRVGIDLLLQDELIGFRTPILLIAPGSEEEN